MTVPGDSNHDFVSTQVSSRNGAIEPGTEEVRERDQRIKSKQTERGNGKEDQRRRRRTPLPPASENELKFVSSILVPERNETDKMEFKSDKTEEDGKKKPNMIRKAKEEIKSLFHSKEKPHRHHHHHKETHVRSDDIDENTHVDEVKAPNVFERAKEEIEAVIDTIHPEKNEFDGSDSPKSCRAVSPEKERAGFGCSLGKWLEKICAPWGDNKKD